MLLDVLRVNYLNPRKDFGIIRHAKKVLIEKGKTQANSIDIFIKLKSKVSD